MSLHSNLQAIIFHKKNSVLDIMHGSLSRSFVSSYILAVSPTTFFCILIESSRLNSFLAF